MDVAYGHECHAVGQLSRRLIWVVPIALLHGLGLTALALSTPRASSLPVMTIMIGSIQNVRTRVPLDESIASHVDLGALATVRIPPLELPAVAVALRPSAPAAHAGVSAPRADPEAPAIDTRQLSQRAGLAPGQGATVVLRIEVRADGRAGKVVVDISSGDRRVDAAAVQAARAQRWIAGTVDGVPVSL